MFYVTIALSFKERFAKLRNFYVSLPLNIET